MDEVLAGLLDLTAPPGATLPRRLTDQLRVLVSECPRLGPGQPLLSSRALAQGLGVSRNTVNQALGQPAAEGYLDTGQGRRSRVAPDTSLSARSRSSGSIAASVPIYCPVGNPTIIRLAIGSIGSQKQRSPLRRTKMSGLVAPLANGVSDARPRKALHHVHGVNSSISAARRAIAGRVHKGMAGESAAFAGRLPRERPERARSGARAAPTCSLDLGMCLEVTGAQQPGQTHAANGGNDCGQ